MQHTHPYICPIPGLPWCDDSIMRSTNHDQLLKLEEVSLKVSAQ